MDGTKHFPILIALLLVFSSFVPGLAAGQTLTQTPEQAAAEAAVLDALEQAAAERVAPLVEEVDRLRAVYEVAKQGGNPQEEQAAAENLAKGEAELEQTRVQSLAQTSGRSEAEIEAMRREGKGWGAIAHETGVHPSALGMGKGPDKTAKAEQKAAKKAAKAEKKAAKKGGRGGKE